MTTPANPSNSKPGGDARNVVAVDENSKPLTFEDTVHHIWRRNRTLVWAFLAVVVVLIVGNAAWEYYQQQQELAVEKDYAAAKTPEQLKSFAAAHGGHRLAGVAEVQAGDAAYAAEKFPEAISAYDAAIAALKDGPLAARAKLGRAMAKAQSGKDAEAVADLKALETDANQFAAIRAEAAYDLASLASEAGNAADVQKYVDELMKIDPSSSWAQRGMMLRATMPAPAVAAPVAVPTSTGSAPAEASKKEEAKGDMQIKLPGK